MDDIVSEILSSFPVRQCVQAQFGGFKHPEQGFDCVWDKLNLTTASVPSGHKFVPNVFSTVVLIEDTVNKQTNIANRTQIIKNPSWWEADQLAIYRQRGRGVELGTTKNKSRQQQGEGFEPGTSRFEIQRPKPLNRAAFHKPSAVGAGGEGHMKHQYSIYKLLLTQLVLPEAKGT